MNEKVRITILLILIFCLGFTCCIVYKEIKQDRIIDGLRFAGNYSHPDALEHSKKYDKGGDWVCINVKGMEYDYAIKIIQHEVAHEIFAEECEDNIEKCMEVIEK